MNATFVPSTFTAGQMLQTGIAIAQLPGGYWARFNATRNLAEVGASGPCTIGERLSGSYRSFNEAARAGRTDIIRA